MSEPDDTSAIPRIPALPQSGEPIAAAAPAPAQVSAPPARQSAPRTGKALTPSGPLNFSGPLTPESGRLTVSSIVVAKIAAESAQGVEGIHALGSGLGRAITSVRDRLPGVANTTVPGVTAEVGQTQAAVDIDVVVEYGIPITEIARAVRRQVITDVERFTGLHVVEANLTVNDINMPTSDDQAGTTLS